jgi:hypothetical protein
VEGVDHLDQTEVPVPQSGHLNGEITVSNKVIPALLTAAALVSVALPAHAQTGVQTGQQSRMTQQMQENMQHRMQQQMTTMIQRMGRLRERIHTVDGSLSRHMEHLQDQQRLREHQALREICSDLGNMTQEMERNAERLRTMARAQLFQRDPELSREADRLREHWEEIGGRMDQSVTSLERMQQRLERVSTDGS